ncbi:MAG: hypothetical protein HFP81_06885 [Methylococcales symbiont of Hymedesmia sp. n. MRB-2018]|nr:MAG: hypothetical protein HFP81_06885 [Methylococcales symbiont of Hymedesmia sp. n. MRB-2018]
MMLTKVLISIKTYPTLSSKYNELVCTAGFLECGTWIRIYPLPFRALEEDQQYKKWQWIELDLERNYSDNRPESHKVKNLDSLKVIKSLDTRQNWFERKEIVKKTEIYKDLSVLIDKANKKNSLSLATFKPTKIIDFIVTEVDENWNNEKLALLKAKSQQLSIFQTKEEVKKEFELVDKLPYKFSYKFEDINGKQATLMIEDWEIGALYWNCLKNCAGDKSKAVQQVKDKYLGFVEECDVLLFLGTTKKFHGWASNPFVIIGLFYPKKDNQTTLFDFC